MPKQKSKTMAIIPDERIVGKIYYLRGKKVMFDRDLAELYGVTTGNLNKAARRNIKRFPADFMFQLNKQEADIFLRFHFGTLDMENLKFQNGISSSRSQFVTSYKNTNLKSQIVTSSWGGRRKLPYVFTEQGVAMLSSVLSSDRAIQVNIQIMRTFTKLREMLMTHKELREKIEKMERKYDQRFKVVFDVIKRFLKTDPKNSDTRVVGFKDAK